MIQTEFTYEYNKSYLPGKNDRYNKNNTIKLRSLNFYYGYNGKSYLIMLPEEMECLCQYPYIIDLKYCIKNKYGKLMYGNNIEHDDTFMKFLMLCEVENSDYIKLFNKKTQENKIKIQNAITKLINILEINNIYNIELMDILRKNDDYNILFDTYDTFNKQYKCEKYIYDDMKKAIE